MNSHISGFYFDLSDTKVILNLVVSIELINSFNQINGFRSNKVKNSRCVALRSADNFSLQLKTIVGFNRMKLDNWSIKTICPFQSISQVQSPLCENQDIKKVKKSFVTNSNSCTYLDVLTISNSFLFFIVSVDECIRSIIFSEKNSTIIR